MKWVLFALIFVGLIDAAIIDFLRVTEIMYNPADPTALEEKSNFTSTSDFSYMELQNIDTNNPLDISGVIISNGITFTFPANTILSPGAYILVVQNLQAFQFRYPSVSSNLIAGQFTGKLSSSNDLIVITDVIGVFYSFSYQNWFPDLDGLGYSIVIIDTSLPTTTWSQSTSWKISEKNGSPGAPSTGTAYISFSSNQILFNVTFQLTLTQKGNPTTGLIKYTTDRTDPTTSSTAITYTTAFSISATTQVQAAVRINNVWGPILSRTYIYTQPNIGFQFSTNRLPLTIIDTFGVAITDKTDKDAFVVVCEPGPNTTTVSDDCITVATPATIHIRGSSSAGLWPKYQYALKFLSPSGLNINYKILGMPKESSWVLQGTYGFDKAMIRNPLTYNLYRKYFNHYAPRTEYTEVLFNQNSSRIHVSNSYWGLYTFVEKIKRDSQRVDIDEMTIYDNSGSDVTGGYIFKIDRSCSCVPADDFSTNAGTFVYDTPDITEITASQKNYLTTYINTWYSSLTATKTPTVLESPWFQYVDISETIDYHILTLLSKNTDGLWLSTFLYKSRLGPISWGPPWDYDLAWGSPYDEWATPARALSPNDTLDHCNYNLWTTMFDDQQFVRRYVQRYHAHRNSWFTPTTIFQIIDNISAIVEPVASKEMARWPTMYSKYSSSLNLKTRQDEINWMKEWINSRIKFMDQRMCYGTNPPCADNNYCTYDVCNPKTAGVCFNVPIECPFPECKLTTNNGGPCDDKDPCTVNDICSAGNCTSVPKNCDDGFPCTDDYCSAGTCVHTPRDSMCSDGIDCTVDTCVVGLGCQFTPVDSNCDDQVPCTQNKCLSTGCSYPPNDSNCDDQIPCTTDVCDISIDCYHIPNNSLCNDNVDCTDDTCSVSTGCVNTPNKAKCDDGVACTSEECISTGCVITASDAFCNDNVDCTVDKCSLLSGCSNVANNSLCEDGIDCTTNTCGASGCVVEYINTKCVDNIDCTTDTCTSTGCTFVEDNGFCSALLSTPCVGGRCNATWPDGINPSNGSVSGCYEDPLVFAASLDSTNCNPGGSDNILQSLSRVVAGLPVGGWIGVGVGILVVIVIIIVIIVVVAKNKLELV